MGRKFGLSKMKKGDFDSSYESEDFPTKPSGIMANVEGAGEKRRKTSVAKFERDKKKFYQQ